MGKTLDKAVGASATDTPSTLYHQEIIRPAPRDTAVTGPSVDPPNESTMVELIDGRPYFVEVKTNIPGNADFTRYSEQRREAVLANPGRIHILEYKCI